MRLADLERTALPMTSLTTDDLRTEIEAAWEGREGLSPDTRGPARTAVEETLALLDAGKLRVAERQDDGRWETRQWAKQAILLAFRLNPNTVMHAGAFGGGLGPYWDKIPNKFEGW